MAITQPTSRLGYLDGCRGIAAFVVAIYYHYIHFSGQFQPGGQSIEAAPYFDNLVMHVLYAHGGNCVSLFFMLSGCVFSHVYAGAVSQGRVGARSFFVRRVARLYPIQLLTLLLTAAGIFAFFKASGRFPVYVANGRVEFLLNLLFLQKGTLERGLSFNGPAWSLSIEAYAYAAFFVVAARGMRRRDIALMLTAGMLLVWLAPQSGWRPIGRSEPLGNGLICFFLGCVIQRDGPSAPWQVLALCGAMTGIGLFTRHQTEAVWSWTIFGALLLALQAFPVLRWPLERRFTRFLGDVSLAIYMIHFPLQVAILLLFLHLGQPVPLASPLFMLAYAGCVLGSGWVLHHRFERPAQDWVLRRLG